MGFSLANEIEYVSIYVNCAASETPNGLQAVPSRSWHRIVHARNLDAAPPEAKPISLGKGMDGGEVVLHSTSLIGSQLLGQRL